MNGPIGSAPTATCWSAVALVWADSGSGQMTSESPQSVLSSRGSNGLFRSVSVTVGTIKAQLKTL